MLLADGRLPAGGHAHSGGIEAAVADGLVDDLASLDGYLQGRLATSGRVDAATAVMSWLRLQPVAGRGSRPGVREIEGLRDIDAEVSARTVSPAQRAAGRAQGRGLLRVARRCWTAPVLDQLAAVHADGPLAPMVLGAAGAVGAMTALEVATAALWSVQSGPAWAAVRLLGLDPLEVTALLARRAPDIDRSAGAAVAEWAHGERAPADLPAAGAPLAEIGAEGHAAWEVRLFAS